MKWSVCQLRRAVQYEGDPGWCMALLANYRRERERAPGTIIILGSLSLIPGAHLFRSKQIRTLVMLCTESLDIIIGRKSFQLRMVL